MNAFARAAIERANYENDPRSRDYPEAGQYDARKGLITLSVPYMELDPQLQADANLITHILGADELAELQAAGECAEVEDWTFQAPADLQACPLCRGTGKVVDPAIDCGGISSREFAEDPGFAEDYFGGSYDILCPRCRGQNVVPDVIEPGTEDDPGRRDGDWSVIRLELYQRLQDWERDEADYQAICAAERRMGA